MDYFRFVIRYSLLNPLRQLDCVKID